MAAASVLRTFLTPTPDAMACLQRFPAPYVGRALLGPGFGLFLGASLLAHENDGIWDSRFYLPGIHGEVRAIATRGTEIYAGGEFTSADGLLVNNVAHWNGTNWEA